MSKADDIYDRLIEIDDEERELHDERDNLRAELVKAQQEEADELGVTRFGKPLDAQTARSYIGASPEHQAEIRSLWASRSHYGGLEKLTNG